MNLLEKLLDIRKSIKNVEMDGENTHFRFKYQSSGAIVNSVREKMNELGVLLQCESKNPQVLLKSQTGGSEHIVTSDMLFTWVNTEDPEDILPCAWTMFGQDSDTSRGAGKGYTYAEKYFIKKFFNIPTSEDDPDGKEEVKDKVEVISEIQLINLREICESHEFDADKTLKRMADKVYRVKDIKDLPANMFKDAQTRLEKKGKEEK